jgi:hypothetical protein
MPEPPLDEDVAIHPGDVATDRVAFDYIKGQLFRVVRADGAIGSVTPNGHIHVAFYSERPAIPRREVYRLSEGRVAEEITTERLTRGSIVRELDVDVFLTMQAAEQLHAWLGQRIAEAKAAFGPRQGAAKDGGQ